MSVGIAPEGSVSKSNGKMHAVEEEAVTEAGGEAEAESSLPFTPITLVCQVHICSTGSMPALDRVKRKCIEHEGRVKSG